MPKIVDRTQRKTDLIGAALEVFSEKGFHGATMQQVADRAGVSKGGLYEYFQSKDDLLLGSAEAILTATFNEAMAVLDTSHGPLRARVETYGRYLISRIPEWAEMSQSMRQIWAELGNPEDPITQLFSAQYRRSADRIERVFNNAVTAGDAPAFQMRPAALSLMALIDGLILQAVIVPDEFERYAASDSFSLFCAGLIPANGASS